MKRIIAILCLVSVSSSFAAEESADDIAKRVIVDKSSAHIPIGPISYLPPRNPEDEELAAAARKSYEALTSYMLSNAVPEKIRLAYAISVLAGKRVPKSSHTLISIDTRKNDKFLKDGLILAARLAEIEEAEQPGADQPATATDSKSERGEKPKSSLFFPTGSDWVHYDGSCPKTHYPIIIRGGGLKGDGTTYRAIFAEVPSEGFQHVPLHGLPTAQYEKKVIEFSEQGYVLIYHQQFMAKGGLTHQAVWVKLMPEADRGEQGADQSATAPDSKSEGSEKHEPESEERSQ